MASQANDSVTQQELVELVRVLATKAVEGLTEDQYDRLGDWLAQNNASHAQDQHDYVKLCLRAGFGLSV